METSSSKPIELFVGGGRFKLLKKVGSGAFGEIFIGLNVKEKTDVAVKLEKLSISRPQLLYECKLYHYLHSNSGVDKGIPNIYYYSTEGDYNVLVMQMLGPSLEDLFQYCNKKFSLKTTIMIAEQILQRMEFLHTLNFIHRDIKPDNFLLGIGKELNKIFMIDLGLAKRYILKDGSHIPYRDGRNLIGTARYASINTHLGIESSRRCDIESLGYMMVYFLKGVLPWQNLAASTKKDKYRKILETKIEISVEKLTSGLPQEIGDFINYTKNLKYEEKPDYLYLREILFKVFNRAGFTLDYNYDWREMHFENKKKEFAEKIKFSPEEILKYKPAEKVQYKKIEETKVDLIKQKDNFDEEVKIDINKNEIENEEIKANDNYTAKNQNSLNEVSARNEEELKSNLNEEDNENLQETYENEDKSKEDSEKLNVEVNDLNQNNANLLIQKKECKLNDYPLELNEEEEKKV